jgi:hypothetical protein
LTWLGRARTLTLQARVGHGLSIAWQPPGATTLWYGLYRAQQNGSGIELGSVLLLGQFSLERGDLLLGLCERGRRAADLRDEFVKGGVVHCNPHAQSPLGDPENCIAQKK